MGDVNDVPAYLSEIYMLIKCAFPYDITDDDYMSLITLLYEKLSFRSIASLLSVLMGKSYTEVYNDALGIEELTNTLGIYKIDNVKQKLIPCGYEQWYKEVE